MNLINTLSRATKVLVLLMPFAVIGATGAAGCSSKGGGTGTGTGTGTATGGITSNLEQVSPGATVSQSEHFTAYGGLSSQKSGTSSSANFKSTSPNGALGNERMGK